MTEGVGTASKNALIQLGSILGIREEMQGEYVWAYNLMQLDLVCKEQGKE